MVCFNRKSDGKLNMAISKQSFILDVTEQINYGDGEQAEDEEEETKRRVKQLEKLSQVWRRNEGTRERGSFAVTTTTTTITSFTLPARCLVSVPLSVYEHETDGGHVQSIPLPDYIT